MGKKHTDAGKIPALKKAEGLKQARYAPRPVEDFTGLVLGRNESMLIDEGMDPAYDTSRQLMLAVQEGRADAARKLLKTGRADPNYKNGVILEAAAVSGKVELLRMLLTKGGNADLALERLKGASLNPDIERELSRASHSGSQHLKLQRRKKKIQVINSAPEEKKNLLDETDPVKAKQRALQLPLLRKLAVAATGAAVMEIIRKDWGIIRQNNFLVFRVAAAHGNLDVVDALLDEVEEKDPARLREMVNASNAQALRIAARKGDTTILRRLIDAGADIHANDGQALKQAARKGHLEAVQLLMMSGEHPNEHHQRAIEIAAQRGHRDIEKFLRGWPMLTEDKHHILMGAQKDGPVHTNNPLIRALQKERENYVQNFTAEVLDRRPARGADNVINIADFRKTEKAVIPAKEAVEREEEFRQQQAQQQKVA
jgi:ankyrin repeat protein